MRPCETLEELAQEMQGARRPLTQAETPSQGGAGEAGGWESSLDRWDGDGCSLAPAVGDVQGYWGGSDAREDVDESPATDRSLRSDARPDAVIEVGSPGGGSSPVNKEETKSSSGLHSTSVNNKTVSAGMEQAVKTVKSNRDKRLAALMLIQYHLSRRVRYMRRNKALLRIQKLWRGALGRMRVEEVVNEMVRAETERRAMARKIRVVLRLQSVVRGMTARTKAGRMREDERLRREEEKRLRLEKGAAVRIQAVARGNAARGRVEQLRVERTEKIMRQEKKMRQDAAATIEAVWRGISTRERVRQMVAAMVEEEERRLQAEHDATIAIQRVVRGSAGRAVAEARRRERILFLAERKRVAEEEASLTLQSFVRGQRARKLVKTLRSAMENAAVRIRNFYHRTGAARRRLAEIRKQVELKRVAELLKRQQAEEAASEEDVDESPATDRSLRSDARSDAVIEVGSPGGGSSPVNKEETKSSSGLHSTSVNNKTVSAGMEQAVKTVKSNRDKRLAALMLIQYHLSRRVRYMRRNKALLRIQKLWRGALGRMRVEEVVNEMVRAETERRAMARKIRVVLRLQSVVRGMRARKRVRQMLRREVEEERLLREEGERLRLEEGAAVVRIQAVARGNAARERVKQLRVERAEKIMRQEEKMRQDAAITRLQSVARGRRARKKVGMRREEERMWSGRWGWWALY